MADKPGELAGIQRAAILLMSLGEQDAANLLKQLDAREVQKLGIATRPGGLPLDRTGDAPQLLAS